MKKYESIDCLSGFKVTAHKILKLEILVPNETPENQNYSINMKHGTTVAIITYLYYNETNSKVKL